ncbi:MAG: DUF4783 domain-containing protein [Ferruginibacter sp.]
MKRFLPALFLFISLTAFSLTAGLNEVVKSISSGDAAGVARYFDNTVELALPQKTGSYSKTQAELVLRDFFSNNPVKSFKVLHQGEKGGSEYCIGTLETRNAAYRTTFFMKNKGDRQILQELRFEN